MGVDFDLTCSWTCLLPAEYNPEDRPSFEEILKVMQSREVTGPAQQLGLQRAPSLPSHSPRRESNPL
jgi:hypothetical protein